MAGPMDREDLKWAREQIALYRERYPNYVLLAETLRQVLGKAVKRIAPLAIVQARPKAIASFGEKIWRKRAESDDPVNQFTDLCGARVITHTARQVAAVSEYLEGIKSGGLTGPFEIDEANSVVASERLRPTEFGYRSIHYIVSFVRGVFPNPDVDVEIPELLFTMPNPRGEVQVRTILEHAWADIGHDLIYKSPFPVPRKFVREVAGLAAALEAADQTVGRVQEGLDAYRASNPYMSDEEIRAEMAKLELVLEMDPGNVGVATRIGILANLLADTKRAISVLSPFAEAGHQGALRELGTALCKQNEADRGGAEYARGRDYLRVAAEGPPPDPDALVAYAQSWDGVDEARLREEYRRAFEANPSDPYPLASYLERQIAYERDVRFVSLIRPVIREAIARCREHATVGIHLPRAFASMGLLHLLLGDPFRALWAYARAVALGLTAEDLEEMLSSIRRLSIVARELPGYQWVRRLLLLGLATKFGDATARAEIEELATPGATRIEGRAIIVAGGCDPKLDAEMRGYGTMLAEAFEGLSGTLISGGTTQGVSGLVGDISHNAGDAIAAIGYLPKLVPADATIDKDRARYTEIRTTDGEGFTPLEPLQNWIDLLASDVHPHEVKILGINGGLIAATEYRIGLALGARVGLIERSGREAPKLLEDEDWAASPLLISLPNHARTIRAFLFARVARPGPHLSTRKRDEVAREIHERYRAEQQSRKPPTDPSMAEWAGLPENLRESNRAQADHYLTALKAVGCSVRETAGPVPSPLELTVDEVEAMAELEHDRWNLERLRDKWMWSKERDVLKRRSPYLASWGELADDIREWDREAVRAIPELLAKIGLEVRRGGPSA